MNFLKPRGGRVLTLVVYAGLMLGSTASITAKADVPSDSPLSQSAANSPFEAGQKASDFIGHMGQEAIDFLGNGQLSTDRKTEKFSTFLDRNFDMESIGRFCLGPYWKNLSPEEQAEYQTLFKEIIVSIYSGKFSDYKGQKFQVYGEKSLPDGDIMVQSSIQPLEGESIPVEWQVRQKEDGYKVMDVKIEGVSMAITKKSEFASYIQKHGGNSQALLQGLRDKKLVYENKLHPS